MLFALVALTMQAQNKVWNDVVTGYSNTSGTVKATKVAFYDDRTEVTLHVDFVAGQWIRVMKETFLSVGQKQYAAMGTTVQQAAIEHFLKVNSFPTYKFIDRDGTILEVNADPRDLEGLARLLDQMK